MHIHGAICKERGLLTAVRKAIKTKEKILKLLEAMWLPRKVAILHCKGHNPITWGNCLAAEAAKIVARKDMDRPPSLTMALTPAEAPPPVTLERKEWAMAKGATLTKKRW